MQKIQFVCHRLPTPIDFVHTNQKLFKKSLPTMQCAPDSDKAYSDQWPHLIDPWCSHLDFFSIKSITKLRLEGKNSLVPFWTMHNSIHYCNWIQGTWPRWRQHDKGLLFDKSSVRPWKKKFFLHGETALWTAKTSRRWSWNPVGLKRLSMTD